MKCNHFVFSARRINLSFYINHFITGKLYLAISIHFSSIFVNFHVYLRFQIMSKLEKYVKN